MKIILSTIKWKQKTYILKSICVVIPTHIRQKKVSDSVFEKINFGDNIEIPPDDEVAVDGSKKWN